MLGNNQFTYIEGFAGSGSGANVESRFASILVTIIDFSALGGNNDSVTVSTTQTALSIQNWTHGSSNNAMAANLRAAINTESLANGTPVVATSSGPNIRIVSTTAGPDGNTDSISFSANGYWSTTPADGFFSGGA